MKQFLLHIIYSAVVKNINSFNSLFFPIIFAKNANCFPDFVNQESSNIHTVRLLFTIGDYYLIEFENLYQLLINLSSSLFQL